MKDPLLTYLHDHLAGASFALQLLETLREQPALSAVAGELHQAIEQDRRVLQELAESIGNGTNVAKEAAGWFAEKISRLKLRHQNGGTLGAFEALETLALGILGKLALWDALQIAAVDDPRLQDLDFDALATRAEEQHALVEEHRLRAVPTALRAVPELHEV